MVHQNALECSYRHSRTHVSFFQSCLLSPSCQKFIRQQGECNIRAGTCLLFVEDLEHQFVSVDNFTGEITSYFKALLQSASEKITKMCLLDKEMWKLLDNDEVECQRKITAIEEHCEKQVVVLDLQSYCLCISHCFVFLRQRSAQIQSSNVNFLYQVTVSRQFLSLNNVC